MLRLVAATALVGVACGQCTAPGRCTPPDVQYKNVQPVMPRKQWGTSGGYCGALSIMTAALMRGNYISQGRVRQANTHGEGHGNPTDGFEVLPTNIEETLDGLGFTYNSFNYNQSTPQDNSYKGFLKQNLIAGNTCIWFVMCKGDGQQIPYPGSNPNNGRFSHIEPVWGILSSHPLNDTKPYDDDWLIHGSDYDQSYYYRNFSSLVDTPDMNGNCKNAQSVVGHNEAYPCIYDEVDYGYCVSGNIDPKQEALPATLSVNNWQEPNWVNLDEKPVAVQGTLTVEGTVLAKSYTVYRYNGRENVPRDSDFANGKAEHNYTFIATGASHQFEDPNTFMSNDALFYRVVPTRN